MPEGAGLGACGESRLCSEHCPEMAPALPGTCPAREGTLGCSPACKALRKRAASSSARVGLSLPVPPALLHPSRGHLQPPQPRPDLPVRQSRARVNTTALIFALDLRAEQESLVREAPANPTAAGAEPPARLEGSPPGRQARGTAASLLLVRSSPGSYQLSLPLLLVQCERPGLRRRYLCRRGSSAEISQRRGPGTRSMWRAGFKDRAASPRSAGLAGAASKQELPAGRASPAKELFTLPVTQIPAGPAALPGPLAAPRDWRPARGQGLFPQGFGLPYPDPSPRPRVCAPSFTGPLTSPPFPAVSPTQRSCVPARPRQPSLGTWAEQRLSSERAPALARPPQNSSQPEPTPGASLSHCHQPRDAQGRARPGKGREGTGTEGPCPQAGLQRVCRAGSARGSCHRGTMLLLQGGTGSLQPQPVAARWAPQGHCTGIATPGAAAAGGTGTAPCLSQAVPTAGKAPLQIPGHGLICSTALHTCTVSGLRGGCECRGGFGKPSQGRCWSPGEVTAPGMDWGHSSCRPLNSGVEQQGKQEPGEDHNHGFICYDPTVQLID